MLRARALLAVGELRTRVVHFGPMRSFTGRNGFCFLLVFSIVTATVGLAEVPAKSGGTQRCGEWTVCSPPLVQPTINQSSSTATGFSSSFSPQLVPSGQHGPERWGLPVCDPKDNLTCKNECHGRFGDDFWGCVKGCLKVRCVESTENEGGAQRSSEESAGCVELASIDCRSSCGADRSSEESRCRRDCLTGKCPSANPLDVAKESSSPGALECERCIRRLGQECRAMCGSGAWIPPGGVVNGLGGLVCEKSCISVRCGVGCSFNLQ